MHLCFGVHFDLFGYGDREQGASRSGDKIGATHNGHSGQFLWPQFCHPNSEAPIIARKAIPKLTEMDKFSVLNTSDYYNQQTIVCTVQNLSIWYKTFIISPSVVLIILI